MKQVYFIVIYYKAIIISPRALRISAGSVNLACKTKQCKVTKEIFNTA